MEIGSSLISSQVRVETPFIIAKIGDYTFGHCAKADRARLSQSFNLTHPSYLESLNIIKVNGAVNTYTLNMVYAITQNDDPNMLEKIFSKSSNARTIVLSYGDWNSPSYIYREETALITKLTTKVNLQQSSITYTINCTGADITLNSGLFSFPAVYAKPSTVLINLIKNKRYGISEIYTGMSNISKVLSNNFIATDDKEVQLEAKPSITILNYISYLVGCMVFAGDTSKTLKTSCYFWSSYDDPKGLYGGTYFKVIRVSANTSTAISYNTYEIDIGYPTADCVLDFNVNNDDSWSLLYDYADKVQLPTSAYSIDNDGQIVQSTTSLLLRSKNTYSMNEATRNWWSKVTQFPITATLTLKGLLRPAMLMSYVKVNTYFYGHKHISSGLYIITQQSDTINQQGYRTTLSLTRVGGDEHYI